MHISKLLAGAALASSLMQVLPLLETVLKSDYASGWISNRRGRRNISAT